MVQKLKTGHYFGENNSKLIFDDFVLSENSHSAYSTIPSHFHKNRYLTYAIEGSWIEKNNEHERLVEPKSLFLHDKHEVHSDTFKDQNVKLFNVEFKNDTHFTNVSSDVELTKSIHVSLFNLYTEFKSYDHHSDYILQGQCLELIGLINRLSSKQIKLKNLNWVLELKNMIDDNYMTEINLSEISNEFQRSTAHLSRAFSESYGITISDYILSKRIDLSIELMKNQSMSLTEIAIESGFYDSSHFTKYFKKWTTLTPFNYRKRCVA